MNKKGQAITFDTAPRLILLFVLIGMVLGAGVISLNSFNTSSRPTSGRYVEFTAANSTAVSFNDTTVSIYSCGTPVITNGTNHVDITYEFTISNCYATLKNNSYNNLKVNATYTASLEGDQNKVLTNTVSGGLNMSQQLPTVGTILGVGLILVVVIGVFAYFAMRQE